MLSLLHFGSTLMKRNKDVLCVLWIALCCMLLALFLFVKLRKISNVVNNNCFWTRIFNNIYPVTHVYIGESRNAIVMYMCVCVWTCVCHKISHKHCCWTHCHGLFIVRSLERSISVLDMTLNCIHTVWCPGHDVKLHPHFHCHWQFFVLMCHEAGQSVFLHTQLYLSTNLDHILCSNVSWH